ncbi:ankyrin repeat-containing domain protein, partial [Baffinella frigidus]
VDARFSKDEEHASLARLAQIETSHRVPSGGPGESTDPAKEQVRQAAITAAMEQEARVLTEAGSDHDRALWEAARSGSVDGVRKAVADGAKVEAMDGWGRTALHHAAYFAFDDAATVRELLLYAADPNAQDDAGFSPLMRAAAHGRVDAMRLLLSAGADIELRGWAAGRVDCVAALLEAGARPEAQDALRDSALDLGMAARSG